jgi:hypothetical protein
LGMKGRKFRYLGKAILDIHNAGVGGSSPPVATI